MMMTFLVLRAFWIGIVDGYESPSCLSSGMTYPTYLLNNTYDHGANLGQLVGSWIKGVPREGASGE